MYVSHRAYIVRTYVAVHSGWSASSRTGALPPCHIHVWCLAGDCGPDQASFRASIRTTLAAPAFWNQWVFEIPCLKHQLHLMCKDSLRLMNQMLEEKGRSYNYFGSVAKVCHTWRAHGKKVSQMWMPSFPDPSNSKLRARFLRWLSPEGGVL